MDLLCFQEMNKVGTWLNGLYETDEHFWLSVGMIDNRYHWLGADHDVEIPGNSSFWLPGEPDTTKSDCACLQAKNKIGLELLGSCAEELYALCKLKHA